MNKRDKFPHAFDLFGYWASGSDHNCLALDPPRKGAASNPFHVVLRGDGHIPLSLLVFARDAEHAKSRVEDTMRECYERGRAYREARIAEGRYVESRGEALLRKLDAGKLTWHIEPYDTNRMAAEINWAGNGGFDF